ncbi:hypothetical protein F6X40_17665 [Paraburkholderia sp. UCT31]|uniref:SPRY domain-containing protein n=1 Tax=Paraburkholderia sp. UCT31 TaxID=2615209 RepID=UPI001655BC98|nr:SPRY domain-containing protein [Paraburkholderia sp. UCT31]MBC8738589.1 hypothetical protein [Paraburkholderia sp. UCT31]
MQVVPAFTRMLAVLCCMFCLPASAYEYRVPVSGLSGPGSPSQSSHTYATWNPSDKSATLLTLSGGNLAEAAYSGGGVRANQGKAAGKWYWEVTITALGNFQPPVIGLAGADTPVTSGFWGPNEFTFFGSSSATLIYGSFTHIPYGQLVGVGDVVGVAADFDNRTVTFYRNGVSMGVAYTSAQLPGGTYYPYVCDPQAGGTSTSTTNFGQSPFKYAVPSGYNAGWYQ